MMDGFNHAIPSFLATNAQHSVGEKVCLTSANALCLNFTGPLHDSGSQFAHLQSETVGQEGH